MRALPVVLSMFVAASAYAQGSAVVYTPRERDARVPVYNNASLSRARARTVGQPTVGTVSILGTTGVVTTPGVVTVAAGSRMTPLGLGTAPCEVPAVVSVPVSGASAAVADSPVVTLTAPVSPYARVIPSLPYTTSQVSLVAPMPSAPVLAAGLPVGAARDAATRDFDTAMRAMALKANELDMHWSRYSDNCVQRTAVNPSPDRSLAQSNSDRQWFSLFSNGVPAPVEDDCRRQNVELTREAANWRDTMTRLEDVARQNDVLPGAMREIRQRYRLEF